MRWDDLHAFLTVAHAGQLAGAARTLGVDATTVGRRLRRLERSLGLSLIESSREGQLLTGAGTRLLEDVEAMAEIASVIGSEEGSGQAPTGLVRISVPEGFGTWFIGDRLGEFIRDFPHVTIDLVASTGMLSPSRGETDIAVLLARPRKGPLISRKLADYRLRAYASKTYLSSHGPIAARDDLQRHSLIGYIPDLLYAPELNYLDEVLPGLQPKLRSSSIIAQYRLTAAGAGVAVLPCFIGDTDEALEPVLPELAIQRSFWLVTHQDSRRLPRVRLLIDWLAAITSDGRRQLLGTG